MADRFPLILNTSANQIQEIASGDTLDLTNNNISNAGVITATSFSGPVVAGVGVSNITAGIGTYTNLRVGGNTTFSEDLVVTGNARVTGILTVGTSSIVLNDGTDTIKVGSQNLHSAGFEVNQINASGIITATTFKGALEGNVTGNTSGTAGGLTGTPDISVKDLDVDGHTNLDNVSVAGVTTFTGNIDANGDLDVDGHTNLDNVNVVGVLTVTGAVNASHSTFGNLQTTGITIENTNATINFTDTNNNPDYRLKADGGTFDVVQWNTGGSDINVVKINTDGHIDIGTNVDFASGIDVTGNVIASGNVSAVDGTFTGNVSIGGTLTYEDVTNIDSVGIVTAREGIFIPDNKELKIGNTAASSDLRIYSNGAESFADSYGGNFYIRVTDQAGGVENKLVARPNAQTELYYNDAKKLQTENTGITVTGTVVATTFSGETVVGDTSPQLGGDLDVNNFDIKNGNTVYEIVANTRHNFKCAGSTIMNINAGGVDFSVGHNTHSDNVENRHGTHNDIRIYHSGSHSYIKNTTDYTLWIQNNDSQAVNISNNSGVNVSASFNIGGAAQLYHANSKKFETVTQGAYIVGDLGVGDATNPTHQYDQGIHVHANGTGAVLHLTDGTSGSGTGDGFDIISHNGSAYLWQRENANMIFGTQGTSRWLIIGSNGHFAPNANNTYDIGTSSNRVRNIYTNDLNLSNEGSKNDVDGTWGNYTIQEGESDLFLINKRNGKKYKFNLTEVS